MTDIPSLYKLFCTHPTITTDTRHCPEGSIFFALKGASFDGNDFAKAALEQGCAYAVVDKEDLDGDERLIHVADVLKTLQDLAAHHRRQLRTPIVQITGTNGKTTTKELTAAVLSRKFNVHFTQGNFNNHIGVPKTLLAMTPQHQVAVVETGANHPGEIAELSKIVDADCGLITNIGVAHIEGFGSIEGVAKTKGELYDYLRQKPGSLIFLHADNPRLAVMAEGLDSYKYGLAGKGYDIEGEVTGCSPFLALKWRRRGGEWHEVQTHLIGAYNCDNALAAAAVGCHFGVDENDITAALADYVPSNNRSELKETGRNSLIIDAYNANPTSMKAALDNFALIPHPHKMMILGEMRELGTVSAEAHQKLAAQAEAMGCEAVWLVGEAFAGCAPSLRHFADVEEVKQQLTEQSVEGRLILIKGSNGTRLFTLPPLL
ncbi:MAG: UDP-N-acetylmuramoyl-tripeptide--D-alanyl-D-alanine ligase [Alloprevotella sp.]